MSDGIMLTIGDDGEATLYDDTYDITIHCESKEEQDEVRKALKNIPHWIPCSDRLPEEEGDYLVTVDPDYVPQGYRSTDVITWHNGKWIMADYFVLDGENRKKPEYKVIDFAMPIIAWMPLPEPFKGVTE